MTLTDLYQHYLQHPGITTDTRRINKGDIFFALKGPNHNGNAYTKTALDAGASLCITDEETGISDQRVVMVNNSLETLQQLASHHRKQFSIPFIAITGTNGKTTTKELLHAVLSKKFITYTTEGNLNNHIGIPLTQLKIKADAEIAVVEMGANHIGEIASYCEWVLPDYGLITNCGKAHLEGFGSEEGVRIGKGELFRHLQKHNGIAFVNRSLNYLSEMSEGIKNRIFYGEENIISSGIKDSRLHFTLQSGRTIQTQMAGSYNLHNLLAAWCVGNYFGVPEEEIANALETYQPGNNRSQIITWKGNKVLLDAYNANPSSMRAAISNFAEEPAEKKILILGAMRELGTNSATEHRQLAEWINTYPWQLVMLVGDEFETVPRGFLHFKTATEAAAWLKKNTPQDAYILLKGSRGIAMEKILL